MESLLAERSHLYEEVATIRLVTDRRPVTELTQAVVAALDHADGSIWLIDASGLVTLGGNVESAPGLLTLNRSLYVFARSNEIAQTYRLWTRVKGHWQRPQRLSAPPAFGGESFVHTRVNHAPATIMAAKP